ncbi:ribonuclease H-like domain-containing protein [Tanacetum coccineum]
MVTTEEMRLRSKQLILSTSTTSSSPQVLLATSQPRIQDNRNNRDRDARNENKIEICRNFGRDYCRWWTNCRFIHASPKGTNNPRPNSSQHNTRSMQQGPGHTVFPYGSMTPHDSPSYTFLDTSPNIISKLTSASPLPTTTITSTAAPPSPPRSPLQPAHQTHESSPLSHSPNVQPTSNASTETTIPTHNHNNLISTHPMVTRFRVGTNRPTQRFNLHVSTISPIPKSYPIAFRDPNWYRA